MLIDELRAVSDKNEMYSILKQMCFDEANKGNYELERYFDLSGNMKVETLIDFNLALKLTKKRFKSEGINFEYRYLDDSDKELTSLTKEVNKVRVNIDWKY